MIGEFLKEVGEKIEQRPRTGVSIVIVVWNAKAYVLECLNTLREQCSNVYDEVIIVDNASTDGTADLVGQMFPEFILIRNPENLGFARANNIGMTHSSGKYICLVNSDVKFTCDPISPMMRYMESNPGVGMLGPKMLGADGKTTVRSTLRFPTVWNTFCRALALDTAFKGSRFFGGLLMTDFDHERTLPVEVLVGWFWFIRSDTLRQIGMMDPDFFMYGEDIDWCYRFWKSGKEVVFFAGAEAIHYGGASSAAAPVRFYLEQCRANWKFFHKHHNLPAQAGYLVSTALHHSIRLVGCALIYLFAPGKRSETSLKLKRSLSCLQWVGGLGFRHLRMIANG